MAGARGLNDILKDAIRKGVGCVRLLHLSLLNALQADARKGKAFRQVFLALLVADANSHCLGLSLRLRMRMCTLCSSSYLQIYSATMGWSGGSISPGPERFIISTRGAQAFAGFPAPHVS